MNYADEFYMDDAVSRYARIRVDVNQSSVFLSGRSIPFGDFASFVVSKDGDRYAWTPKFASKQPGEDDKVVDMLFPIVIGAAELFCSRSYNSSQYISDYLSYLKDRALESIRGMVSGLTYEEFLSYDLPTDGDHDPQRTAKFFRSKFTPQQGLVDDLLQHLSVLNIVDKRAFYEEVVSLADMCSAFLTDFADVQGAFCEGSVYKTVTPGALFGSWVGKSPKGKAIGSDIVSDTGSPFVTNAILSVSNYVKDHGAVHATLNGLSVHLMKLRSDRKPTNKTYKLGDLSITDCTSFCIGLFAMFAYHLGKESIKSTSKEKPFEAVKEEDINQFLNECLGKDALSRYLRKGFESSLDENQYKDAGCGDVAIGDWGICSHDTPSGVVTFERTVTRHEIEMTALVKAYFSNTRDVELSASDPFRFVPGSYYGIRFAENTSRLANSLLEIVGREFCEDLADQKEQLTRELTTKTKSVPKAPVQSAPKETNTDRIAELEAELERKRVQAARLQEDNEALSQMLADLKADIERESSFECSEDLSTGEIIDYLNAFSILFVGGRCDMKDRLNEMGLVNIYQANKVSAEGGIPSSCDYLCNMTSFMSHTLYFKYKSSGIAPQEASYNFKGTNIDRLLRELYSFIKSREAERDDVGRI